MAYATGLRGRRTWWSIFWTAVLVCVIIVYFVLRKAVTARVDDSKNFCSEDAASYDLFSDPPEQDLQAWVYNLTNPGDYLLDPSANAKFEELGPFGYGLQSGRKNITFTGKSELAFTLFNQVSPSPALTCDGCDSADATAVTVPNVPYLGMLQQVGNEATLLLSLTCNAQKIGLMYNAPSTVPYCTAQQAATPAVTNCKCCYPKVGNTSAINANSFACASITSLSSKNAHVVSWLASYDGNYRLNSVPSNNFVLSSGSFSPLVRTMSVTELLFGTTSALVGTVSAGAAISSNDAAASANLITSTQDLKDVCYRPSLGLCPQISELLTAFNTALQPSKLQVLRSAACNGTVPSYEVLIADGMPEERALQLRYLEGVPCKPFTPAIVIGTMIALNTSNTYTCLNASETAPCCLKTFQVTVGQIKERGAGIGCVSFMSGVLQKRRVYSVEEASVHLESNIAQSTTCGNDNPLMLKKWYGAESVVKWFTPSSYSFPLMSWADPTVIKAGLAGAVSGSKLLLNFSSAHVANQMPPGSMGRSFLNPDLNDGSVAEKNFDALVTTFSRVRTLSYVENTRVKGIQAARYNMVPLSEASTEESQKAGELPYPNMINMAYSSGGKPVIVSSPNYLDVNPQIFDQSSNLPRSAVPGKSVEMYRTRDGYNADSAPIDPQLITTSTAESYSDVFSNFFNFEPVTGLSVKFQMSTMMSTFTWNCNSLLDKNCELMRNMTSALCYAKQVNGVAMYAPCSATNVFTPFVQGQKVLPLYWSRVQSNPPEELSFVAMLLSTKFGFSILCVIVPVLLVVPVVFHLVQRKLNKGDSPSKAQATADEEDNLELENIKAGEKAEHTSGDMKVIAQTVV